MATVTVDIKKLLEAGAHFGHKTSRWHPKMAPYIHSKRDGNHIIDLTHTVSALDEALAFIEDQVALGKQIVFVGTKRQAHDAVKELAVKNDMPFVVERWLGGMLTNKNTMNARIKYLKDQEAKMENGQLANKYNKLEVQRFQEEIDEMNHIYGGIKDLAARPGAVFVIDINHDANAVREAVKLDIPVIALVDTNTDPTDINYAIPCNDDSIKTVKLICEYVDQAVQAGKNRQKKASETKAEEKAADDKKEQEKQEEK